MEVWSLQGLTTDATQVSFVGSLQCRMQVLGHFGPIKVNVLVENLFNLNVLYFKSHNFFITLLLGSFYQLNLSNTPNPDNPAAQTTVYECRYLKFPFLLAELT